MTAAYTCAVALSVLLTQPVYALAPDGQPTTQMHAGAAQMACPAEDFSAFIRAFSNDVTIQKAFTQYPLKYQWVNTAAEPEPKPVLEFQRRDKIRFPLIPLQAERVKQTLQIKVDHVTPTQAKATMFQPDTDYVVSYYFKKHDRCWELTYIDDQSL